MKKEDLEVSVIVGAGGTGSDFIRLYVHYVNESDVKQVVKLIDKDTVEKKNLLRQKFLNSDLNKFKAGTLVNRYQPILNDNVRLEAENEYINSVDDIIKYGELEELTKEYNVTKVRLISCVDNNMARLRLLLGMYAIHEKYDVQVEYADSGNELWNGQTLGSILYKGEDSYFKGLYELSKEGLGAVQGYKAKKLGKKNILWSIFVNTQDWVSKLTKGDFELSCDDVTISSPQNIATNMQASIMLLNMISKMDTGVFKGGYYTFNAKNNSYLFNDEGVKVEEGYEERMEEVLDYVQSDVGYAEVYSDEIIIAKKVENDENVTDEVLLTNE